ncbi:MAG: DEAD/DEAH box helicase [bacterium]|nr:DEAD/DEAH box helicase [bacterium]
MPRTEQRITTDTTVRIGLAVSAQGALRLETGAALADTERLPRALAKVVERAFREDPAAGLLHLASKQLRTPLCPSLAFGREIGKLYLGALRARGDAAGAEPIPPPDEALSRLLESIPPLLGAEYATPETLARAWRAMDALVRAELAAFDGTIHDYLQARNSAWHAVGRVTFHLAEQKGAELPFAFLATYAEGVAASGRVRHLPLGKALAVYRADREQLLRLLRPVQAAAARNDFVKALADSGELYEPLAWTPAEAHAFLLAIPDCEAAGVAVRVPDWWKGRRPGRVQAGAQVGAREPSGLGMESVLSFDSALCLDGRKLTAKERRAVLDGARGLRLIRGEWVEIDPERLREAVQHFESVAALAGEDGLSFAEGMRLLARAGLPGEARAEVEEDGRAAEWTAVEAGPWLTELLRELRAPDGAACDPGAKLRGTLRPYQRDGVAWLRLLARLGLGGCLADDMGLGKTIQVIALMLLLERDGERGKHVLVVPASLLGNWQAELARFAPSLNVAVAHRSELAKEELAKLGRGPLRGVDVVLTTYGTLTRLAWLREKSWSLVVIDEAHAIKNPSTAQARAVKSLRARMRFALTGTPVENRPGEVWSLFDFLCPGLLGSAREFTAFTRRLTAEGGPGYGPLRRLLQPYILRRMKTDRAIAPDLPDKTQLTVHCSLRDTQVVLYEEAVRDMAEKIQTLEGVERRGLVLATLLRLKQICNHPSQWTGDGDYDPRESGKFARLAELCETIVARQEKLLVFTQFRALTRPLADYLAELFARPGLVLHGGTPVKRRTKLVAEFQSDGGPPFAVLSLKAGGAGLNLTAANHVIHFDRWWNPAVEDQATDRAFRIGQRRNVLVHAFSCRGTIEDKIDAMLASKRLMAEELLAGGPEKALTELDTDELLELVALDVRHATS